MCGLIVQYLKTLSALWLMKYQQAIQPFEHVDHDEDVVHVYETLFDDHPNGREILWIRDQS